MNTNITTNQFFVLAEKVVCRCNQDLSVNNLYILFEGEGRRCCKNCAHSALDTNKGLYVRKASVEDELSFLEDYLAVHKFLELVK